MPIRSRKLDQIARGRVFELKTRSVTYPAPIVLVIGTGGRWPGCAYRFMDPERGCRTSLHQHPSGLNLHALTKEGITRRIARRRPELERYDDRDLQLIEYGCAVEFGGRLIDDIHCPRIPGLPGVSWTAFWTPDAERFWFDFPPDAELQEALNGAWHFSTALDRSKPGFGSHPHAWVTAHRDPVLLRRIEGLLRRRVEGLSRIDLRWERKDHEGDFLGIHQVGFTDWLAPAGTPLTTVRFGVTTVLDRRHGDSRATRLAHS